MLASVIDAGPPAVRSGCVSYRTAGRALVRADVPCRLRTLRRPGQDSSTAESAHRLASARRRRHAFLRRLWSHPRWTARLRSVLQTTLLPRPSDRGVRALARRNELSRRVSRRADCARTFCLPTAQALARGHRFRRAAMPAGPCRGTARQFHQRRALGPAGQRPVGDGIPTGRRGAPASFAALRVRARGNRSVRTALALRAKAATRRRGVGTVPDRLRQLPLCRRIRARARQLPRRARAWAVDGTMVVAADDRRRRRADALGLLAGGKGAADAVRALNPSLGRASQRGESRLPVNRDRSSGWRLRAVSRAAHRD